MGNISLVGATSGGTTLVPQATGTYTVTLPASSDTLATVSNPTFTGTVTATTVTSPSATALTIQSAGTTAMTVDTSQNVGIGTTSPGTKLDVNGTMRSKTSTGGIVNMDSTTTGTANTIGSYANAGVAFADLNYSAAQHLWLGGGSEKMRIDSSGNVGIGTTSPTAKLAVNGGTGNSQIRWEVNNSAYAKEVTTNAAQNAYLYKVSDASYHRWDVGGSEAMRIDSSGNLLVGTTTSAGRATFSWVSASQGCLITRSTSETYAGSPVVFQNSSGATAGFISQATSSVSYNTSSDYRMKENVAPLNGGLTTISALKPVTYDWKIDGSSGEGFIAHEVQAVIPHAVTGEKDAVNEDGSVKSQGVDYSKIVVHLVAAIQELSAKNAALEARLAALEAK